MNAPAHFPLPDLQAAPDARALPIDEVGIRGLRLPLLIAAGAAGTAAQPTIATATLAVALAADVKGTHMSRFVELVEAQREPLTPERFRELAQRMLARLGAEAGRIELRFPWFVDKRAPVSGVASRLDVDGRWQGRLSAAGWRFTVGVVVPVTSLCPCSKEISAYGAHNQRSHVTIEAVARGELPVEALIALAERAASCELYGLLKRPDEKHVTERAYDNPKFVEDLVRDVVLGLRAEPRVAGFRVEVENFESIHNHSALARHAEGWPADAGSGRP